jgi:pilus assembly protein Flp/PilA
LFGFIRSFDSERRERSLANEKQGTPYTGSGRKTTDREEVQMSNTLLKLYAKFYNLKNGEEGQDLVEYALLVALIALVCISGVSHVATAVTSVFNQISSSLA